MPTPQGIPTIAELAAMQIPGRPQVSWTPAHFQPRGEVTPSAATSSVAVQPMPTGEAEDTLLSFLPHAIGRMIGGGQVNTGHYETGADGKPKWVPAAVKSRVGDIFMGGSGQRAKAASDIAHEQNIQAEMNAAATQGRLLSRDEAEAQIAERMSAAGAKQAPVVAAGGQEAYDLLNTKQKQDVDLAMKLAQQQYNFLQGAGKPSMEAGWQAGAQMPVAEYMRTGAITAPEGGVSATLTPGGQPFSVTGGLPTELQQSGVKTVPGVPYPVPFSTLQRGGTQGAVTSIPVNPGIAANVTMTPQAGFGAQNAAAGNVNPVPGGDQFADVKAFLRQRDIAQTGVDPTADFQTQLFQMAQKQAASQPTNPPVNLVP